MKKNNAAKQKNKYKRIIKKYDFTNSDLAVLETLDALNQDQ